ncbi:hypothetical protein pb186bvf_012111 [Paramecium bursaria]
MQKIENCLGAQKYSQHQEISYALWKRPLNLNIKTSTLFSALHIFNNKILLIYISNNQMMGSFINKNQWKIDESFIFQTQESMDYNFIHHQTFLLKDSIFFICNYNRFHNKLVYFADITKKQVIAIDSCTKPVQHRTNYTVTQHQEFRLIIFGGFDDQMKVTNAIDQFCIDQCDFIPINTKGQPPQPRHSHLAIGTAQSLIIASGSNTQNLFDRTYLQDAHILNLFTQTWSQLKCQIPKAIGFGVTIQVSEKQYLGFNDFRGKFIHYLIDIQELTFKDMLAQTVLPEFRFGASACLDAVTNQVYLFGGFNFLKNTYLTTQIERMQLLFSKDKHIKVFEGYNGEKINLEKIQNFPHHDENLINDIEELTFEELIEQEKKLQEQDQVKKKKKNKKR